MFSFNDLKQNLKLNKLEVIIAKQTVAKTFEGATPNPTLYPIGGYPCATEFEQDNFHLALLPHGIVVFNEFEEIKLANQNAEEAKRESKRAYKLAMVALLASSVIGLIEIALSLYSI
jgi:hypothetical protein